MNSARRSTASVAAAAERCVQNGLQALNRERRQDLWRGVQGAELPPTVKKAVGQNLERVARSMERHLSV